MPWLPRSLVAITTGLVVSIAHVVCACPFAKARPAELKPEASHRCCEHRRQVPAAPVSPDSPDHPCPHCDGGLAAPLAKAVDCQVSAELRDDAVIASMPALVSDAPVGPNAFSSAPATDSLSPPTLLRLHCALNL